MQSHDYGPFPYVPIKDRPKLEWPGGARVAVWVIPNIEFFPLTRAIAPHPGAPVGNPPSVRAWAQRDYGNRVGIWRLMDVLSKHGIRASPTLNSDICDHHPQIVRAAIELGWEILGHNRTNSVWLDQLGPEEERQTIAQTLSRIAEMTGRKPAGWLGAGLAETWHTLDYLAAEGCLYEFEKMIRRQFDTLYAEGAASGRVMAICLHPYLIGVPHRIAGLDSALAYIRSHAGVWFATGEEIVRHWLQSGATF